MGFVYDIAGRYWVMNVSLFLLAVQLSLIPHSAPDFTLLFALRAVMSCLMRIVLVNPLILDYVKSDSRGVGMSIVTYGFVFGELAMIGLFEVTRKLSMEQ